ncbi:MAG: GNAT family N-acetyltransferase [Gammaproteobacteria bacterium]|nr:GNAT family N-acetyltransferase [Gammaproteobacteria bacterium]
MNGHPDRSRPAAPGDGIRRIGYAARDELKRHLLRLSAYHRRMRFNGSVSDRFIETYCRGLPGASSMILGYYADGALRGAAELFILTDNTPRRSCEIALSVEADHQGRGIGTSLVERMLVLASNRRVRTMHVLYVHGNKRMDNIVRRFDTAVNSDGVQAEAVLTVPPPDDLSVFEEAMTGGARRRRGRVPLPGADCAAAARARMQGPLPHR